MRKPSFYEKYIKRLLDIIFSLTGIIILSPVLIITAILVSIKLGSPVIFTQVRLGKDEKQFKMCKFRTMTDEKDDDGELLQDKHRITSFGENLRKYSIDELPELINIFKGDMSIVGPRPLLPEYLKYYTKEERKRHKVRPGLTGLAQINGRNFLNWEERFQLDINYVENVRFRHDLCIIIRTIVTLFSTRNIANISKTGVDEKGTYIEENGMKIRRLDVERSELND